MKCIFCQFVFHTMGTNIFLLVLVTYLSSCVYCNVARNDSKFNPKMFTKHCPMILFWMKFILYHESNTFRYFILKSKPNIWTPIVTLFWWLIISIPLQKRSRYSMLLSSKTGKSIFHLKWYAISNMVWIKSSISLSMILIFFL